MDLLKMIQKVYPDAQVISDIANSDNSIKFVKHGYILDNIYVAIKCKDAIEIYDNKGILFEVIDL